VENIHQARKLAHWGEGSLGATAWSTDESYFALSTSLGVHLYAANSLKEIRFISTGETIRAMTFSPDGRKLAAGCHTVRLWDPSTGDNLGELKEKFQGCITNLSFSPGGSMIAAIGTEGNSGDVSSKLLVWDTEDNHLLYSKEQPACGYGNDFTFSPDGKTIAYTECSATVYLIKASSGEEIQGPIQDRDASQIDFSADGKLLLIGSDLVDLETGQTPRMYKTGSITGSSFLTPDGKIMVATKVWNDQDQVYEIQLWDVETTKLRFTLPTDGRANKKSLSPDGSELAVIEEDGVRFWNVKTAQPSRQILWESPASALSFGNVILDGESVSVLISGNPQGRLTFFDLSNGKERLKINLTKIQITDIAVHPDGKRLAIAGIQDQKTRLRIYNLETRQVEQTFPIMNTSDLTGTWGLAFSLDGEAVAARTSPVMDFQAWNIQTGEEYPTPERKNWFNAESLGASLNGHFLQLDDRQGIISDRYLNTTLSSIKNSVIVGICVEPHYAMSFDNRFFSLGCEADQLYIWDLKNNRLAYALDGHKPAGGDGWSGNITNLSMNPYGYLLVTSGHDGTLRFWDVSQGKLLLTIQHLGGTISFSPDGRYLAANTSNGLHLWGLSW
jgi:WD40 repeat protein